MGRRERWHDEKSVVVMMMMMVQWSWLLLVLWLKRKKRVGEREAGILQKVKSTVEREQGRQLQGRKKEQVSHGWRKRCVNRCEML